MENETQLLGLEVQDRLTGFTGLVTGICVYLTGCNQALVQPKVKDGAFVEARWIDVQRLDRFGVAHRVTLQNRVTPGCDVPAPIR